jgi:hypothetical protein
MKEAASILLLSDSYSSGSGGPPYVLIAVAVAIVVLAIAGLYFWNLNRKQGLGGEGGTPESLLVELCEVHELSKAERSLLTQLARSSHLSQPAAVFADPGPLEQAASSTDPDAPQYRALRNKLFGSLEPTA